MADLVPIPGCNATIRRGHYASIAALFAELQSLTGIVPQVLDTAETIAAGITPQVSGGARPLSECIASGSSALSDHFEDNAFGRSAIDLNNHRDFRAALGDTGFTTVMNKHGWFNMDISGNPFPVEPWHFANHDSISQAASAISAISLERLTDMSVLHIHPVINADQYKLPFLLWNEVTFAATGLDQHARDNLVALGVAEGAPVTSMQVDEADTFRAAVWNAKLLPGK